MQNAEKEIQQADESKRAQLEEKFFNDGMYALWRVGKLEVEATLRRVCDAVLNPQQNTNVERAILKKRAEGLKVLGRIFKTAKQ